MQNTNFVKLTDLNLVTKLWKSIKYLRAKIDKRYRQSESREDEPAIVVRMTMSVFNFNFSYAVSFILY